jgi:hypothetical protein
MSEYIETLRKKAREIAKKRAVVVDRLKADNEELLKLSDAENGIAALLRLEGVSVDDRPVQTSLTTDGAYPLAKGGRVLVLKEVLKETLSDGRPRSIDELIAAARQRGIDFGERSPWKAVNFTLMGIKSGKTIERIEGNRWRRAG